MFLNSINRCVTGQTLFGSENALRTVAKTEASIDRQVHFAQCALLTQRQRFSHEEKCEVCLAAQVINQ
jgi:hypothetical protein